MRSSQSTQTVDHPLLSFLLFSVLAFLITWGTGTAVVFSTHSEMVNGAQPPAHPVPLPFALVVLLLLIGAYGPACAAVIVTWWESGGEGVRNLLRQFRRWRIGWIWFVIALLGPALLGLTALIATSIFGLFTPASWFSFPPAREFAGWAFGPWGEELGWRGYAQPKLQRRWGAFATSLLVGLVWWTWHHWPMATPGAPVKYWVTHFGPSGAFLVFELANSVLMAWLYNSTGGSLPVAWAAHVGLSLGGQLVHMNPHPFGFFLVVFWTAALLVLWVNGPRTLSRIANRAASSSPEVRRET